MSISNAPVRLPSGAAQSLDGLRLHLLGEMRRGWREGRRPSALEVLDGHPDWLRSKTLVIELINEEICQTIEAGLAPDGDLLCKIFPAFSLSIDRLFAIHGAIRSSASSVQTPPSWPRIGDTTNGCELLEELGQGSFARVYLAADHKLGKRPVVLKMSVAGGVEADTIGALEHPNIVQPNWTREDEDLGLTVVSMPYHGRATLDRVIARLFLSGKLPSTGSPSTAIDLISAVAALNAGTKCRPGRADPRLTRRSYVDAITMIVEQLADALAYAYEKGYLHRDLKPSNVLLTPEGVPVLLDFNLSLGGSAKVAAPGGTLPYMAPEQIEALLSDMPLVDGDGDPRSDLFSLAALAYELLSGAPPFGQPSRGLPLPALAHEELLKRRRGPEPLCNRGGAVDPLLASVVEAALAYSADDRPDDCRQFAAMLRGAISRQGRAKRWILRNRLVLACAGVLFMVGLAAGGAMLLSRDPYWKRELDSGKAALQHGDPKVALEHFTRAAEAQPTSAETWFACGRAHQASGQDTLALVDFEQASGEAPSARIEACNADCFARLGRFDAAIAAYNRALDGGFASGEMYSNLGLCYMKRHELAHAKDCFDAALKLNHRLRPALHNRAMLDSELAFNNGRPVSQEAAADIELAVKLGPPWSDLLIDAARIECRAIGEKSSRIVQALEYLEQAVEQGADPVQLGQDSILRPRLAGDPRFQNLLRRKPPAIPGEPEKSRRLVDSLGEDLF